MLGARAEAHLDLICTPLHLVPALLLALVHDAARLSDERLVGSERGFALLLLPLQWHMTIRQPIGM